MHKSSNGSASSPTHFHSWCFDGSHPNGCRVASHGGFDLTYLMISEVEHLFRCLLAISISSLETCIQIFLSVFELGYLLLFLSYSDF